MEISFVTVLRRRFLALVGEIGTKMTVWMGRRFITKNKNNSFSFSNSIPLLGVYCHSD